MTIKQFELLQFIQDYFATTGISPTYQQIKAYLNVRSNQTVSDRISALINEGYLSKSHGKQQGLKLTEKSYKINAEPFTKFLPLAIDISPSYLTGWQSATSIQPSNSRYSSDLKFNITITERSSNVSNSFYNQS